MSEALWSFFGHSGSDLVGFSCAQGCGEGALARAFL